MPLLLLLSLCVLRVLPMAASAQPIATDRPDFTESTETVPRGRIQLEAGVTYERDFGEGAFSGPESLLRYSPARRLELRLELPDYTAGGGAGTLGDAAAGVKVALGPVGPWGLAAIGMLTGPIGDSAVTAGGIDPLFVVTAGTELPGGLS